MLKYLKSRWQEIGWAVLIASSISIVSIEAQPNTVLSFGTTYTLLDTSSAGSVTGSTYALPTSAAQVLNFQSVLTGGPSAVSIPIQVSLDGTNWQTIATFTTATGQVFSTGVTSYRFLRAVQNSRTGGTNTQLLVNVGRAFQYSSTGVNLNNVNLSLNDGSNTVPSLNFASNNDTGLRYVGPDSVAIVSDGTQRLVISSTNGIQATASINPTADNARDLGGGASLRWRDIYVGTSVAIGTNYASAGNLRLPHAGSILARQSTNSADTTILSYGSVATDQLVIGTSGINLRLRSNLGTPTTLANNEWWVDCTGTSPSRVCAIKVQDGGATRTIGSMTY